MENVSFLVAVVSWGVFIVMTLAVFAVTKSLTRSGKGISSAWKWYHRLQLFLVELGLAALTVSLVSRAVATGHGPFSNMYEFAVAFAWGIVAMGLLFQWCYHAMAVLMGTTVVAFVMMLFASTLSSRPAPLVPALQQSFLLTAHVAAAVIAYGVLTAGFITAVLYLVQARRRVSWLPGPELLDTMSYRAVAIGFPFMTLLIVLGALWADIAWGRYWSWDPKETASLVTWLLYAIYLHSRVIAHWRGGRAAVILIIGFAAVLFTFFGNYIFAGLHAYQ